ncbi:glutaredoxin 2 [Erwiniaceae bacterium CAU 1747]
MKLHIYQHCPFCHRARMIFGLKNQPVELSVIMEGDAETPTRMVGKKVVPILEKDDGTFMPESMDIVHYVDGLKGDRVAADPADETIVAWSQQASGAIFKLVIPRFTRADFAELATPEARAAYTRREIAAFGNLDELAAQSAELIAETAAKLTEIEPYLQRFHQVSTTEFILFPLLNSLTVVKDFPFSPACFAYLQKVSALSQVPLFVDKAL